MNIPYYPSIAGSFRWLTLLCVISIAAPCGWGAESDRPNILLIVADDLGYADLGCYGGDIETPNIDSIATSGLRFSRFHTASTCAPTRAMLLSGNDNHIAGMGAQNLVTEEWGYEGRLTDRIVPFSQLLKDAGYHTYMAGKWHLGKNPEDNPHQKGFEHSFALIPGAGNHYNAHGIVKSTPISTYTEDGKPADWKTGDYSTNFYTDKLIEYISDDASDDRPFFALATYTSPHWPLQVDEAYWRKYEGRYDEGYEVLKKRRLESLKQSGLISEYAVIPEAHERVKPWDSLSVAEQKMEARKMELYAGMVDNLDFNVGRLIQHLKSIGEFENTLIVFMSDNGAAADDWFYHKTRREYVRAHFNHDYENMGKADTFVSYGPQWAEAGSSPFRYFKGQATEGGMVAAMLMSGPGVEKRGDTYHGLATVMDMAPTFLEAAKTDYPKRYGGKMVHPMKGASMLPLVSGRSQTIHSPDYVFGFEQNEKAMLRKGDWKIVQTTAPFSRDSFTLHNLTDDLSESRDLREVNPEKYVEMLREWDTFAAEIRVQFPTPKP